MEQIVWSTQDNEYGENTLKQHGYKSHIRMKKYTNDKYNGNKALCNRGGVSNDGETFVAIDKIINEPISISACKKCLRIAKTLKE